MNRIVGNVSLLQHISLNQRLLSRSHYSGWQGLVEPDNSHMQISTVSDDGAVVGVAVSGTLSLAYLGWVNVIETGEASINGLDDPNQTAAKLLQRYQSHGRTFLDGVYGSYVLTIVDTKNDLLLLARDPSGSRRVYYVCSDSEFAFASHLADMQLATAIRLPLDRSSEDFLLAYEFLPDDGTLYQGVEILKPGKLLTWRNGEVETYDIATPDNKDLQTNLLDLDSVVEELSLLLTSAIEEQIPSAGKIGVMLGGFDSALIASILVRLGREVETFTFQYEDESYNQEHVNELSGYLGIRHNWVPISATEMARGLHSYSSVFNQPVSQAHYPINSAIACEHVRARGILHCLTGDGCDDLFLGYPTVHQRSQLIQHFHRYFWLLKPLNLVTRIRYLEQVIGHPYRLARNVLRILSRDLPARAYISACSVDDFTMSQLRRSAAPDQQFNSEAMVLDLASKTGAASVIKLAYMGKSLVGLNRTKIEGCSAHAGVVLNSPYLHPRLNAFAKSLPEQLSRPNEQARSTSTGKYALMEMAERKGYLPDHIITQKKMSPVTAPVDSWYFGDLRELTSDMLKQLPFECDPKFLSSLLSDKFPEKVFRESVGISRYTSNALSMLLTYASFAGQAAD